MRKKSEIVKKMIMFSEKYSGVILFFFSLLFVFELVYLKNHLVIDSDLKALFRGDNQTVKDLLELDERMGGYSTVMVVAKSEDFKNNLRFFTDFKDKVEKSPLVRFVEMENDIEYLEKRALLFLSVEELKSIHEKLAEKIRKEISNNLALNEESSSSVNLNQKEETLDLEIDKIIHRIEAEKLKYNISRYFTAEDGRFMAIKIRPVAGDTSIEQTKQIIGYLNTVKNELNPASYNINVEVGGDFQNKLDETKAVSRDVFSTLGLCVFLLCVTIIFYFRSFLALFVILIPLSIGVVSGVVTTQIIVGEFNIISAFSFSMLYGLGIDFGIHLLSRYAEEKESGLTRQDALIKTYKSTVPSIFSGMATTAAAFFSLLFLEFKGFADFGLVGGVGVLTSFIFIVIIFPFLIIFFEKHFNFKTNPVKITFFKTGFNFLRKHRSLSLTVFSIVMTGCLLLFPFVKFEYNMGNLSFPHKNNPDTIIFKYRAAMNNEKKDLMSETLPAYILTDSLEETADVKNVVEKLIKDQNQYKIKTERIMSIYNFVPEKQDEKIAVIKKIERIVKNKKNLFSPEMVEKIDKSIIPLLEIPGRIEMEKLPDWIIDKFKERDGTYGKITSVNFGGGKSNIKNVSEIKKLYGTIKGKLKDYKIRASYLLLADIKNVIDNEVPRAAILSFIAVLITVFIQFRSVFSSLIVLFSLISGFILMFGWVSIFGIELNLFSAIVIPTIVGIGIDCSIHIFNRFEKEGNENPENILMRTGSAVFFSSFTTLIGFFSMLTAQHRGLKSIGVLASVGITSVTVISIFILPLFLSILAEKHKKKET
ncbi:MAG TPA: MMPL family transporter [bacterium]|nr:MMPL family transporter [bacterium]